MSTIFIVGGSTGIGKQLSNQLAQAEHNVYATYFKHEIPSGKSNLLYTYLNVLDENNNFDFLPETVDGLVYCPGSINLRPFERIKPVDFLSDFNLQVVGAIKVIQALLPRMKKSPNASIVVFSTVAVQTGFSFHSQVSVSKGALEGMTKALAAEFAPIVRVNCIAPSLTDTPLSSSMLNSDQKIQANAQRHPLKRIGTTEDAANMAEFLLSVKSSWITGQTFHVDGGMSTLKV